MRQKWHIFHKVDIFSKNVDIYLETSTYTLKCRYRFRIWTCIPKCGQIFQNVDIYPKMGTQYQKSRQNHTKMDKILENDTFAMSKLGIEYSVQVWWLCPSFSHLLHTIGLVINRLSIRLILFFPRCFFVTRGLICGVFSVTYVRHKLVPKYKH